MAQTSGEREEGPFCMPSLGARSVGSVASNESHRTLGLCVRMEFGMMMIPLTAL